MQSEPKIITVTTFIDKLVEFVLLEQNRDLWSRNETMKRTSKQVRLRQLAVLIPLFIPHLAEKQDVRTQLEMILSGEFVRLREPSLFDEFSLYEEVFTMMRTAIDASGEWESAQNKEIGLHHIENAVRKFFDFKCMIQRLRWFSAGIFEISYGYSYAVELTSNIAHSISTDMIDKYLSMVIDPMNRSFHRSQLISNCEYPSEDVYELEMEEW